MAWYFGSIPRPSQLGWLLIGGVAGTVAAAAMFLYVERGGEMGDKKVLENEVPAAVGVERGGGGFNVLTQFNSKTGGWTIGSQKVESPLKADAVAISDEHGWEVTLSAPRGDTSEKISLRLESRAEVDKFLTRFIDGNTHIITGQPSVSP